jgi:hypothetical protein
MKKDDEAENKDEGDDIPDEAAAERMHMRQKIGLHDLAHPVP